MFSVLLVMFLGCQSNTPVQPTDNSLLPLERPSIVAAAYPYSSDMLSVSWTSIGGAKKYRIYRLPTADEVWTELAVVPVSHGQKTYSCFIDVSSWSGTYYTIEVDAFNRKGAALSTTTTNVSIR